MLYTKFDCLEEYAVLPVGEYRWPFVISGSRLNDFASHYPLMCSKQGLECCMTSSCLESRTNSCGSVEFQLVTNTALVVSNTFSYTSFNTFNIRANITLRPAVLIKKNFL